MHEQGIAARMVSVALDLAQANQARRITQFRIGICETADESSDALRFYLEHLTRGTMAQDAQFDIDHFGTPARCLDCGNAYEQQTLAESCPRCHSDRVVPSDEEEFKLVSIEIE